MKTNVSLNYQLGRFTILPPLRVGLKEEDDGWIAYLNPEELTGHEEGYGATIQEALTDLEEVIEDWLAVMEKEETLGPELMKYRELLRRCCIITGTAHLGSYREKKDVKED